MRCELVKQTKLPRGKIGQASWRILNMLYYIILEDLEKLRSPFFVGSTIRTRVTVRIEL